jgi:hypothetical protein
LVGKILQTRKAFEDAEEEEDDADVLTLNRLDSFDSDKKCSC